MDHNDPLSRPPSVGPWDINTLMLTSGTTGPSRLVSVPHGLTYSDCDPEWFPGARFEDPVFVSLPLFHVSGQGAVYNGLVMGATVVVADRFHSSTFWQEATAFEATFAPILGVMPNYLMNRPVSSTIETTRSSEYGWHPSFPSLTASVSDLGSKSARPMA